MTTAPSGFADQEALVPSHVCLFHDGYRELRAWQRDFFRIALADPQQGVSLIGVPGVPAHLKRDLEIDLGRSLEGEVQRGKLVLVEYDTDPCVFIERLQDALAGLSTRGYASTRALAMPMWDVPGFPLPEDHLWLESRLNAVVAGSATILICAYDLTALPASALAYGGLETHPQLMLAGRLTENPAFVEPDRYLADRLLQLRWLSPTVAPPSGA
jgi:hypothetical protein